jgi:signal transduction histidine kinase
MDDGRLRFEFPDGGVVRGAVVDAQWTEALLRVDERLEIVHGDAGRLEESARPVVALPSPLADLAVVPSEDAWEEVLDVYRRRILMMVSEGTFFAIMLFVLIGLLWRTLRREVELQRQHRNFLSAITHELKSPLAGTRLALETVISGRADAAASERFLGNAVRDVDRLQGMVQQVLETTRYGHGGRLELRRSDISEIVEASIADIRPRVEVLEGEIVSEVEPRCFAGVEVEGFTIVISNLLDNAVKYGGRPPRVVVSLRLEGDWAILEVSDNGAGVAEDDETSIFERFYRSGDELSRTTHGTGLGLYLVQQIVRAHRGTVGVAATGPDGTTFRVEIPGAELKESGP